MRLPSREPVITMARSGVALGTTAFYLVRSSPDGRTCLTDALSCTVSGLRNGTPNTFTIEALTGAGWSIARAYSSEAAGVARRACLTKSANSAASTSSKSSELSEMNWLRRARSVSL